MIKKLTLITGFAAGYLLGAKAGTERYDQIMAKVDELLGKPQVQKATDAVVQTASDLGEKTKSAVTDKVEAVTSSHAPAAGDRSGLEATPTTAKPADAVTSPVKGAAPSGGAPDVSLSTGSAGATTASH